MKTIKKMAVFIILALFISFNCIRINAAENVNVTAKQTNASILNQKLRTADTISIAWQDTSSSTLSLRPSSNIEQAVHVKFNYIMNDVTEANAGDIEIRLPYNLFLDRDGNGVTNIQMPIPLAPKTSVLSSFNYYVDIAKNEIVITNYETVYPGTTLSGTMVYKFLPSDIKNGYTKSLEFLTTKNDEKITSNKLNVNINTFGSNATVKKTFYQKYEAWQEVWGTEPNDTDEYYYTLWNVVVTDPNSSDSTQPYKVTVKEEVGSVGKFVGWIENGKITSENETITSKTWLKPIGYSSSYRVLTKYPKGTKDVTNKVTVKTDTIDGNTFSVSTLANYTYSELDFEYDSDSFKIQKSFGGSDNLGLLTFLREKKEITLNDGLIRTQNKGWKLTNNGTKSWTTELINDLYFFENTKLEKEDYSISSMKFNYEEADQSGSRNDRYPHEPVDIYYKTSTEAKAEWKLLGTIQRFSNYYYEYKEVGKDTVIYKDWICGISFPEGTVGYKAVHTSDAFSNVIDIKETKVNIYPTEKNYNFATSLASPTLHSVGTLLIKDYNGVVKNTPESNTISGTLKEAVIADDLAKYGKNAQHDSGNADLKSISKSASTNILLDSWGSETEKHNDYENGYFISDESNPNTPRVSTSNYIQMATANYDVLEMSEKFEMPKMEKGIYYILIPKGVEMSKPKNKNDIHDGYNQGYEIEKYEFVENWQNSGQTMLIVNVKRDCVNYKCYWTAVNNYASGMSYNFDFKYSFLNARKYGFEVKFSYAYRNLDDNFSMYSAGASDSVNRVFSEHREYFRDLDRDGIKDNNLSNVVYNKGSLTYQLPSISQAGVMKRVKNNAEDTMFQNKTTVREGNSYQYELSYVLSDGTYAKDIKFYDSIENYNSSDPDTWKGLYEDIDVSYLESVGVKPVIYYSTQSFSDTDIVQSNLNDTSIWKTSKPSDLSTVKSIVIDASKKSDNSDYIMSATETLTVNISMRAPFGIGTEDASKTANNQLIVTADVLNSSQISINGIVTMKSGIAEIGANETKVEIEKSANPTSGTNESPGAFTREDGLVYSLKISNSATEILPSIEVEDTIPTGLTIDESKIQVDDGTGLINIANSNDISYRIDGQKIIFTIKNLQHINPTILEIPTKVSDGVGSLVVSNTAVISKIGQFDVNIKSNSTYHILAVGVDLEGKKVLTGNKSLREDMFEFEVLDESDNVVLTAKNKANGDIDLGSLIFSEVGAYKYIVKEVKGSLGGIEYDNTQYEVEVIISTDNNGGLEASVTGDKQIIFNNSYVPKGSIALTATKTLNGTKSLTKDMFEFEVVDTSNDTVVKTAKNNANGNITFGKINYTTAGTYNYAIKEVNDGQPGITYDKTVKNISVEVTDDGEGNLDTVITGDENINFVNSYAATGSVTLSGIKTLNNKTLTKDMFSFELYKGATKVETVTNEANGAISFTALNYTTLDIGTHNYTVKEVKGSLGGITYDTTIHSISVEVSDNGNGTLNIVPSNNYNKLNFTNSYASTGSITLSGIKTLNNKTLTKDMFSFELYKGATKVETVTNEANGAINFKTLNYSLSDVGTHNYTVKEVKGSLGGITYDTTVHDISVVVSDNGDGTLSATASNYNKLDFTNSYAS
ncbi:pilin isopeptide linkage protein, partial [Bacilli bacterium PM5-3]|nr:pilin isopeptide linkage protein [Bacilli bacterium PM5-3]